MTPELASICSDVGITVVHPAQHRPFTPMQTAAENTLDAILREHGESHLRDVLTILTESDNNKHMLIAPVIKAVSKILIEHPSWYAESAGQFLKVMDAADLAEMHRVAKLNRRLAQPQQAVAIMILEKLRKVFRDEKQDLLL